MIRYLILIICLAGLAACAGTGAPDGSHEPAPSAVCCRSLADAGFVVLASEAGVLDAACRYVTQQVASMNEIIRERGFTRGLFMQEVCQRKRRAEKIRARLRVSRGALDALFAMA